MMTALAPLLVLGWGNLSRGDDALGPLCLQQLRDAGLPEGEVSLLDDYQLQVEHALDLVGRRRVLFVDASLNCPAPFQVTRVQAAREAGFSTHAMSPQALLHVYGQLHSAPAPACTLLAIRGERFGLGEPPSAAALAHLAAAMPWVLAWLADATMEAPTHA